jgi:hypothetical protein
MYKKLIISEDESTRIKNLYNIFEQNSNPLDVVLKSALDYLEKKKRGEIPDEEPTDSTTTDTISDTSVVVEPGSYYMNPNYESVKIKYYSSAIPMNKDAEILLKSIAKDAGMSEVTISSTKRTYEDQARANFSNRATDILNWYGADVLNVWKSYKQKYNKQEFQKYYAEYLKKRDADRKKLISNHLSGIAFDVVPFNEKFATTAERLMKMGNSGIKKVLREPENGAVHMEFNFPVTGQSGAKTPSTKQVGIDSLSNTPTDGIIIDTKNRNSNEYALVYGGYPSSKYGAKFMQEKGKKYLNKNVIYADKEKSLETIEAQLKKINPSAKITSVSGFSGGGANAIKAMDLGKFKFIGLIDPYITSVRSTLPSNVKMISRAENWTGYPNVREVLKKMENSETSEKIVDTTYNHDEMPDIFFQKYGNLI